MPYRALENEMLGEDVRIKVDKAALRDKFRQWIEPILTVLVAALIGLVVWLVVLVLGVQSGQTSRAADAARGSANVCRFMQALGIDAGRDDIPNNRCNDPDVRAIWIQYDGEVTRSVATTGELMDLVCNLVAGDPAIILPEQCEGRVTGG